MADDTFRQRRPIQDPSNPEGMSAPTITGNIPPQFMQAMQNAQMQDQNPVDSRPSFASQTTNPQFQGGQEEFRPSLQSSGESHLRSILENLKGFNAVYEEIQLPSMGRFYDGTNGPLNGIISIRAMTGEEEQILATPRFVKKGQAINMIFEKCIKGQYRPENLLTIDRTFLLIYLRGISYSHSYDVELKCPECSTKFNHSINLDSLYVEHVPDDFGPALRDVLPTSKLPFSYRLSTGRDEQEISDHRDRRIKAFGDAAPDDTLIYRTALLLNDIDGITNKTELQVLLKNMPINDVSYIRNCILEPPFGVDTDIEIICPSCLQDFEVDLPMDASFFFPRRKKSKSQA